MRKCIVFLSALFISLTANSQELNSPSKNVGNEMPNKVIIEYPSERSVIWADDFSDASTWVIDHDASACDLDWQIGIDLAPSGNYAIAALASTTYANGSALVDSDLYGGEAWWF